MFDQTLLPYHFSNSILTIVLFICKTKSRLRQRHCGLVRHFKTDPTESVALCFGYAKTAYYNDEDFEFWRVRWLHTRGRWCSKKAKINFKLRITRIFTCFDHKMVSVSIFTIIKTHFFFTKLLYLAVFFAFFIWKVSLNLTWIVPSESFYS
jgi:hypothetical protein